MRDSYKYSLHTDIEEDKGMDQGLDSEAREREWD